MKDKQLERLLKLISKTRKLWGINPKTRVKPKKKKRRRNKQKTKKELNKHIDI